MKIIFDYNRTLFNPETGKLIPNTIEVLKFLSQKNQLFLISRNEPGRREKIRELKIDQYFQKTLFVNQKGIEQFQKLVNYSENVLIIGDRLKDEIMIGNLLGYKTIWVKQGKFMNDTPACPNEVPTYTISSLEELLTIKINNE